jgi:hypothetical protein
VRVRENPHPPRRLNTKIFSKEQRKQRRTIETMVKLNERLCQTCGIQGVVGACKQCHLAYYCSRECQRKDWVEGGHRKECGDVMARKPAGAEKHAADPVSDGLQVEVLGAFFSVEEEWKAGARGYCLDCLHKTGQAPVTSYFCDGCTKARICNMCEFKFQLCRDCRGAHVSRRVPGDGNNGKK